MCLLKRDKRESMLRRVSIFAFLMMLLVGTTPKVFASEETSKNEEQNLDVKDIIFEHLGDGYGWEVPFNHTKRIPLPVIVKAQDGKWFSFLSSELTEEVVVKDEATGREVKHLHPVIKEIEKDGKTYRFMLAHEGSNKDKVVELIPCDMPLDNLNLSDDGEEAHTLHGVEGVLYEESRPLDISITKNVCALFISVIIVLALVFGLVRYYARRGLRAPRKGMGFFEMLISFVYYDTIKSTLGESTKKFGPYLLTCFFFIFVMNLLGLIVIFPGGANLTGNIAVTLVLAVMTFLLTNIFGTKHYWKEIFWPEVPVWLKCPIPIMQLIEVFGIFTKPAALCVRLFANMMGGHMIVITLTLLIFIFASFGMAVAGGATVVSILFSVFMLALDVLVSFIQAYVFTLLSALFISVAQEKGEHHVEEVKE